MSARLNVPTVRFGMSSVVSGHSVCPNNGLIQGDAGNVRSTAPPFELGAVPPQLDPVLQSVHGAPTINDGAPLHVNESLAAPAGAANVNARIDTAAATGPRRRLITAEVSRIGLSAGVKIRTSKR
jgi:hypothetical protein